MLVDTWLKAQMTIVVGFGGLCDEIAAAFHSPTAPEYSVSCSQAFTLSSYIEMLSFSPVTAVFTRYIPGVLALPGAAIRAY